METYTFPRSNKCVPIERVETKIKIRQTKLSSPRIKINELPLMLLWACTAHKVQGK